MEEGVLRPGVIEVTCLPVAPTQLTLSEVAVTAVLGSSWAWLRDRIRINLNEEGVPGGVWR